SADEGKDAVANAEAAAQIIGAAVDTEKAKLKSALDAGQLSYKQYFDALTAIEIASLDAQIRAKQAALAAATKPDERAKAEGEIAKLEEQEQAIRINNATELAAKEQENADKLLADDEKLRAAHGETYAAELAAIGKIVEAHDKELALAGATDAQRRASNQELLTTLTQQAEAKDAQAQAEQLLTSIEQQRRLIDTELKDDAITQVEAKQRLQALATQDVPRLQQQLDIIRQIADALHDPKLQNLVIKLTLEMEGVDLNLETDQQKEFTRLKDQLAQGIGRGIADGVAQGFETGLKSGNIGKGFQQLAASLLSGIGSAMVQFGEAALITAVLMDTIKKSLASLSPGAAIVASLAMIAAGSALEAAASSAFGNMGGGAGAAAAGAPQTINIALPGGVGQGGAPIPGAQPPAVPFGARPVP